MDFALEFHVLHVIEFFQLHCCLEPKVRINIMDSLVLLRLRIISVAHGLFLLDILNMVNIFCSISCDVSDHGTESNLIVHFGWLGIQLAIESLGPQLPLLAGVCEPKMVRFWPFHVFV